MRFPKFPEVRFVWWYPIATTILICTLIGLGTLTGQITPPTPAAGASLSSNTFTGAQTLPAGAVGTPSLLLSGVTGGWYASSNLWTFTGNGISNTFSIQNGFAQLNNASSWCWSSTANSVNACDTGISRLAAGVVAAGTGASGSTAGTFTSTLSRTVPSSVATLPTCNSGADGAHAAVTDSTVALTAGIGAIVAGGAANHVPVTCDGTNWRIG